MKARVKATGEIVDIDQCSILYEDGRRELMYGKELEEVEGTPDYWEKLKHQAAISAMQGIMANTLFMPYDGKEIADLSNDIATALVNKLKGE